MLISVFFLCATLHYVRSEMISLTHYNSAVDSIAMEMFDATTWAPGLNNAWNAVREMSDVGLYMLQTTNMPNEETIEMIQSEGEIELDHFVPPDLYFFFATKAQATALRGLAGFVEDVQAVPHQLKVSPALSQMQKDMAATADMTPDVLIELSPGSRSSGVDVAALAAAWEGAVRDNIQGSQAHFTGGGPDVIALSQVKGSDMAQALQIVSAQPEAFYLEYSPQNAIPPDNADPESKYPMDFTDPDRRRLNGTEGRRLNDQADEITQSGEMGNTPLRSAGLTGRGEVVGIADSGLDDRSCFFNSDGTLPTRNAEADPSLRKVIQYIAFADGVAGEPNDHGTHVAGSVAGNSIVAGGSIYNGMAPEAKIHFFDIGRAGRASLDVPRNLQTGMFPFAKEAGAAIHTNSWGSTTNRYTLTSRDVDAYSFANPEFVVLVAAGNDGQRGANTVGSPATAKNCISVGASVNMKRGSIEDIAFFSSRGPTADGRIKPDVVAPGHNVLSAASERTCAITSQSGTSMATPVCAGTVALVRQYFREGYYPSGKPSTRDRFVPSGALLKAVIVHSGKQMTGQTYGDTYPGNVQGFGRIDMDSVLQLEGAQPERGTFWIHSSKIGLTDNSLRQGQSFEMDFTVLAIGKLKATLVWMDPASSTNARSNLVNDLDLEITIGNQKFFPNGRNNRDTLNNVEMIERGVAQGTYKVKVTATTIRSGTAQPFALVVTGAFNAPGDGTRPETPTPAPPTPAPPGVPSGAFRMISRGNCAIHGLLPIRDAATCQTAARTLGLTDTTVTQTTATPRPIGCYFKDDKPGNALFLATNPANTAIGAFSHRFPLCKVSEVRYVRVTSGNCASQGLTAINDAQDCIQAATELGLSDTTVTTVNSSPRPEGCYYKGTLPGNALFFARNAVNAGNGAASDRHPLCKKRTVVAGEITGAEAIAIVQPGLAIAGSVHMHHVGLQTLFLALISSFIALHT